MLVFLDSVHQVVKEYAAYFSGVAFLLGLAVGHWLAIGRDRRLERIEVKQRIRVKLLKAKGDLAIDDDLLIRMLHWWERDGFKAAVEEYGSHYANLAKNAYGEPIAPDPIAVAASIDKLLPYTAER